MKKVRKKPKRMTAIVLRTAPFAVGLFLIYLATNSKILLFLSFQVVISAIMAELIFRLFYKKR